MTNTVNIHVYKGTPKCDCDPYAVFKCELDLILSTTQHILFISRGYKYATYTYLRRPEDRSECCPQRTVETGSQSEMMQCIETGVFKIRAHRISIHLHNDNDTTKDPGHWTEQPAQEENVPRMDEEAFLKEFIKRLTSSLFPPSGYENFGFDDTYPILSYIVQYKKPVEGEDVLLRYVIVMLEHQYGSCVTHCNVCRLLQGHSKTKKAKKRKQDSFTNADSVTGYDGCISYVHVQCRY